MNDDGLLRTSSSRHCERARERQPRRRLHATHRFHRAMKKRHCVSDGSCVTREPVQEHSEGSVRYADL